jgi:tRNA (guanine26-N2/guanine27-N2)-dimethyltransferase
MTASGVRAIRYLLECPNVQSVEASDVDPESARFAHHMAQLNGVVSGMSVAHAEANSFLLNHADTFDLVDLDPFGSPVPFFESGLRSTTDGGVLAATATDMAPLTGARGFACFRKYNILPVRSEFAKEVAVRILAASLTFAANRLELGTRVVFSHASDHYSRVYVEIRKGKKAANESTKNLGLLEYCTACSRRDSRKRFEELQIDCEDCGAKKKIGGLLWLGRLWDVNCVNRMNDYAGSVASSRIADLQKLINHIEEEAMAPPFYYRVDYLARSLGTNPPKVRNIINTLKDRGYVATRTHFDPNGFRTNAPNQKVRSEIFRLAKES